MAKDENGLHIQTEQELAIQQAYMTSDLSRVTSPEDLENLAEPLWMTRAREAAQP